jgi:multisubunit Na+/H+ antiporter MnhB subunit
VSGTTERFRLRRPSLTARRRSPFSTPLRILQPLIAGIAVLLLFVGLSQTGIDLRSTAPMLLAMIVLAFALGAAALRRGPTRPSGTD